MVETVLEAIYGQSRVEVGHVGHPETYRDHGHRPIRHRIELVVDK